MTFVLLFMEMLKMTKMYSKLSFGCDPEVFLVSAIDQTLKSAIGRFGGSKQDPRVILKGLGAVQEDNVAVEFNIKPVDNSTDWFNTITKVFDHVNKEAIHKGLRTVIMSSAHFPEEELAHPRARSFGCEPDFNAWTDSINPRPELTEDTLNLRTCGGHIHVGYESPTHEKDRMLIKAMDIFLGVPSIFLDGDLLRRSLFGKAGSCRYKPYGIEYRTLSNFWLGNQDYIKWVFTQTNKAIEYLNSGGKIENEDQNDIMSAINLSDQASATKICGKYPVLS